MRTLRRGPLSGDRLVEIAASICAGWTPLGATGLGNDQRVMLEH